MQKLLLVPAGDMHGEDREVFGCGTRYQIDYLPNNPIVVESINWDPAWPAMSFTVNEEAYSSSDDRCGGCFKELDDGGLRGVGSCKCGFYAGSGPVDDPGSCALTNFDQGSGQQILDESKCTQQAAGNVQLAYSPSPPLVYLYDAECRELAYYRLDQAPDDCGLPYTIEYFGQDKPIVITELQDSVDDPKIKFDFNGRSFGMEDPWRVGCVISEMSPELGNKAQCKCGFYIGE